MRLQELIAGKNADERVNLEGESIPVAALTHLLNDGYENVVMYRHNKTFSLWGKACSACFSREYLEALAG